MAFHNTQVFLFWENLLTLKVAGVFEQTDITRPIFLFPLAKTLREEVSCIDFSSTCKSLRRMVRTSFWQPKRWHQFSAKVVSLFLVSSISWFLYKWHSASKLRAKTHCWSDSQRGTRKRWNRTTLVVVEGKRVFVRAQSHPLEWFMRCLWLHNVSCV